MGRTPADSSVFHAIAHPTRRAILDALRDQDMTAGTLMHRIARDHPHRESSGRRSRGLAARRGKPPPLGQSAFSQHLAVLRRAGLVASRKSGRARVYSVSPHPLRRVVDWVAAYDKFWTEKLTKLGEYLDRTHGREPEPQS